jgi:hypothetical protein
MTSHLLTDLVLASWMIGLALALRNRRAIVTTVRALPVRYRIGVAALMIACAFIPGPVDDLIVVALVARIARRRA